MTATKKGKKFCPDSKGIAEETIEQAFIESYRLLGGGVIGGYFLFAEHRLLLSFLIL